MYSKFQSSEFKTFLVHAVVISKHTESSSNNTTLAKILRVIPPPPPPPFFFFFFLSFVWTDTDRWMMIHEKCLFSYLVNVFAGLWQNHDRLCIFCGVWLLQSHDAICVYVVWLLQNQSELSLDDCLRLFMKEEELEAEERPVSTLATSFLLGWVGSSSVGWVSDWKARQNTDVGLIPWCDKGFFSWSQISLLVKGIFLLESDFIAGSIKLEPGNKNGADKMQMGQNWDLNPQPLFPSLFSPSAVSGRPSTKGCTCCVICKGHVHVTSVRS